VNEITVTLLNTGTLATTVHVVKLPADERAETVALDFALEKGRTDSTTYMVNNIQRGGL
jgi:hypothetical protein